MRAEPPPFTVVEPPAAEETPLCVEVPHAGLFVDGEALSDMIAPLRCIGRDADMLVDEVYSVATEVGATLIVAHFSRYVIDLNRGLGEVDGSTVEGGVAQSLPRGLIWRTSTDGDPILSRRLRREELERRLDKVYRPYHAAVASVLERKRARFGRAILLCGHSMPSHGRRGHVDVGAGRADVVPGTRARTTARSDVIDHVEAAAVERGFSVKHDDPYKGGFSTGHYGRPAEGFDAIQIELARRLYLDETRLSLVPEGVARARAYVKAVAERLGDLRG